MLRFIRVVCEKSILNFYLLIKYNVMLYCICLNNEVCILKNINNKKLKVICNKILGFL